jgi:hypothetical protein
MVKLKIGIVGKARSGKNTAAEFVHLHGKSRTFAFADPIKEMIMTMFPQADRECLWGPSELRSSLIPGTEYTYRQALLEIGALGRKFDPDIWVKKTIHIVNKAIDNLDIAILSDVRFKNELKEIKEAGFITIRIIRPNNNYILNDISEIDLDDMPNDAFHHIIVNDGDLNHLQCKVDTIIDKLKATSN